MPQGIPTANILQPGSISIAGGANRALVSLLQLLTPQYYKKYVERYGNEDFTRIRSRGCAGEVCRHRSEHPFLRRRFQAQRPRRAAAASPQSLLDWYCRRSKCRDAVRERLPVRPEHGPHESQSECTPAHPVMDRTAEAVAGWLRTGSSRNGLWKCRFSTRRSK